VTIAAGFCCDDALILATDTEYWSGGIKIPGRKLFVLPPALDHKVAIAGAGDVAFMKMAVDMLSDKISHQTCTANQIQSKVQEVINEIYKKHIYPYPAKLEEKPLLQLLVAAWTKADGLTLFGTALTAVFEIKRNEYLCLGFGSDVASYIVDAFWQASALGVSSLDTEMVAVHAVAMAKKYAQFCGGDTELLTLEAAGFTIASHSQVELMEGYCENFMRSIAALFVPPIFGDLNDEGFVADLNDLLDSMRNFRRNEMALLRERYGKRGPASRRNDS
jgi:20S proteasome alpha/beta subunit